MQYSFWSWTAASITPLIFKDVAGSYILRGVGKSRTVPGGEGNVTYDFDLQSGSDRVNDNFYFGYVDASVNPATGDPTNNTGMPWRQTDDWSFRKRGRYLGNGHGVGKYVIGGDFGAGSILNRCYSIQAYCQAKGTVIFLH